MFQQVTGDFQQVTVQGQVSFRVQDAKKTAALLDFSLLPDGKTFRSDDPQQLRKRVIRDIGISRKSQKASASSVASSSDTSESSW